MKLPKLVNGPKDENGKVNEVHIGEWTVTRANIDDAIADLDAAGTGEIWPFLPGRVRFVYGGAAILRAMGKTEEDHMRLLDSRDVPFAMIAESLAETYTGHLANITRSQVAEVVGKWNLS
jgi:hypothetical protein